MFGAAIATPLMLAGCGDGDSGTTLTGPTLGTSLTVATLDSADDDESGGSDGATETTSTESGTETTGDTDDTDDTDDTTDTDDTESTTDDTGADGCSDSDSGNAPAGDNDDIAAPDAEQEPFGGIFVPQEDVGGADECDVFLQDCVPGEKCVPYAANGGNWDANKCVPVLGDGMIGDPCTWAGIVEATDDCDENSACWDVKAVGNEQIGTCTAFCGGTPENPTCAAGTSCLQAGEGSIAFCIDGCNPLTQECPDGEACFFASDAFSCIFTTSDIPTGQPCGFINDCAEGNMCASGQLVPNCNGSACCAAFCDLDCGANVCTTPNTTCVPFFEEGMAPLGSADVGVCLSL
jgi:hypothetical protein